VSAGGAPERPWDWTIGGEKRVKVNYAAIALATFASFAASGVYYGFIFAETYAALMTMEPGVAAPWQIGAQLLRDLIVTCVLARMIVLTGRSGVVGALGLAVWIWLGFQAMAIAGSVIHEGYAWRLYALHVGDALMKAIIASLILGAWPSRAGKQP
jgi:hypothetical protein